LNALVIGYGITGKSAAEFLIKYGNKVYIYDDREEVLKNLPEKFKRYSSDIEIDIAIKSPGFSNEHKIVKEISQKGIELISEIELAARNLENEKVVAVTGTNGKSTTVSLIAQILKQGGKNVFLCGNIGDPIINGVGKNYDILVIEMSSYQIEGLKSLHPDVSAILNVSPDHLDRYDSYEDYLMTKAMLAKMTKDDGLVVLNGGDEPLLAATSSVNVKKALFSSSNTGEIIYRNGNIYFRNSEIIMDEIELSGIHNVENIMASILCADYFGVSENDCMDAIYNFKGLPHRTEFVDSFEGVTFVDDSKGTNVGAVEKSMAGFEDSSLILILGGVDKGGSYEPLVDLVQKKCRGIVLIGSSKDIIRPAFEGVVPIEEADSMILAVEKSFKLANGSGTVLLSPACSSFDWYSNYKERGKDFVKCVAQFKERRKR
jgi:UDP-N-acetylmuramoylalanine--D-glutamate ligase